MPERYITFRRHFAFFSISLHALVLQTFMNLISKFSQRWQQYSRLSCSSTSAAVHGRVLALYTWLNVADEACSFDLITTEARRSFGANLHITYEETIWKRWLEELRIKRVRKRVTWWRSRKRSWECTLSLESASTTRPRVSASWTPWGRPWYAYIHQHHTIFIALW